MSVDKTPTARFENLWLPPVADENHLPANATEGQLCFVQAADQVFVFLDGRWQMLQRISA